MHPASAQPSAVADPAQPSFITHPCCFAGSVCAHCAVLPAALSAAFQHTHPTPNQPLQLQRQREGAKVLLRALMHAEMGKGKCDNSGIPCQAVLLLSNPCHATARVYHPCLAHALTCLKRALRSYGMPICSRTHPCLPAGDLAPLRQELARAESSSARRMAVPVRGGELTRLQGVPTRAATR